VFVTELHIRYKRNLETGNKKSNGSQTVDHDEIKTKVFLALSSQACPVQCLKSIRGKRGRPGPRGSPGKHGPLGASGPHRTKGNQGPQGLQGSPGPEGLQGPKGDLVKSISAPSTVAPPTSIVMNESDTTSL